MRPKAVQLQHKMLSRLLASHILLVTIPLFITGQLLISTAQTAIEETILGRNLELAKSSARQIESTLKSARDILRLSAQSPAIYLMNYMSQELTINNIVNQFSIFKKLSVLDKNGALLSSTAFLEPNSVATEPNDEKYLPLAQQGKSYSSEVYISSENLPIMDVFEPIIQHNEPVGILWAEVDLKAIWALVDSNVIGKHGEAFIFRDDGQFIAHTDRRNVLEHKYFTEEEIVNDIANGHANRKIYTNRDNVEMIVAYAPIFSKRWGTVIQQPTSEAFAPSRTMRMQILLLMLIGVMVAASIAFFYTRKILQPVDHLMLGINRVASGDLHYRIESLGKDEISRLAEGFNEMSARLLNIQTKLKRTERLDTLGKLASVLSHEIRNPLNSMVINMQILRREFRKKVPDIAKLEHYHKVVVSEIKRVDELVSNFLIIAKPPLLERNIRKLAEILDEVITSQQPDVLPKGIRVERQYRSPDLEARVDANKIKQVFLNIILNAVQAMQGGGRLLIEMEKTYTYETESPHEMVRIMFKDHGKGIKPEDLQHIFDFYYSTKPDGTGLGLSVAQQIIEEHGGYIKVNSEIGKGSEFIVYLPTLNKEENE